MRSLIGQQRLAQVLIEFLGNITLIIAFDIQTTFESRDPRTHIALPQAPGALRKFGPSARLDIFVIFLKCARQASIGLKRRRSEERRVGKECRCRWWTYQ